MAEPTRAADKKALALAFARSNQWLEARALYIELCGLFPEDAEAWFLRGAVNAQLGFPEEAIQNYKQATRLKPDYADAHNNMGTLFEALQRFDEALGSYQQALDYNPQDPAVHYNLGNLLRRRGQVEEAIEHYKQALSLNSGLPEIYLNFALAVKSQGDSEQAIDLLKKALELNPGYAAAHNLLGNCLQKQGRLSDAIDCYKRAIKADPCCIEAYCNNGNALLSQGDIIAAEACYKKTLELKPDWAGAHSNVLLAMNYRPEKADTVFAAHKEWADRHCKQQASNVPRARERKNSRIRVGYVSPDFRVHSVAYFIKSLIASHDRSIFEVYCYADVASPDAFTGHLESIADRWHSIYGMPDNAVADLIRNDQIDILVDLAGHTGNNRLLVFCERPAPIQVSYLGYPNTTGTRAIGYRLTDAHADPAGVTDSFCSETLVRLPNGFLCYSPPGDAPGTVPPPCQSGNQVTFGSFNNLSKISVEVVEVWSRILRKLPNARIILKNSSLADPRTRDLYQGYFLDRGIEKDRVQFLGRTPSVEKHFSRYGLIDIALDTFPYNGTTTTCEALWMGVPVVTLAGKVHASRVGVSILKQVGLDEMIARDVDTYVSTAIKLAADPAYLARLRSSMRERISGSSLGDVRSFTKDVERAYEMMLRDEC